VVSGEGGRGHRLYFTVICSISGVSRHLAWRVWSARLLP